MNLTDYLENYKKLNVEKYIISSCFSLQKILFAAVNI